MRWLVIVALLLGMLGWLWLERSKRKLDETVERKKSLRLALPVVDPGARDDIDRLLREAEKTLALKRGKPVGTDRDSIAWVDELLQAQRVEFAEHPQALQHCALLAGTVLGSAIARQGIARWRRDPKTSVWGVELADGSMLYPYAQAAHQVAMGGQTLLRFHDNAIRQSDEACLHWAIGELAFTERRVLEGLAEGEACDTVVKIFYAVGAPHLAALLCGGTVTLEALSVHVPVERLRSIVARAADIANWSAYTGEPIPDPDDMVRRRRDFLKMLEMHGLVQAVTNLEARFAVLDMTLAGHPPLRTRGWIACQVLRHPLAAYRRDGELVYGRVVECDPETVIVRDDVTGALTRVPYQLIDVDAALPEPKACTVQFTGFDPEGEPQAQVEANGSMRLEFSMMPPSWASSDAGFEKFDSELAKALDTRVVWEDRTIFLLARPRAGTLGRLARFFGGYRARHQLAVSGAER